MKLRFFNQHTLNFDQREKQNNFYGPVYVQIV